MASRPQAPKAPPPPEPEEQEEPEQEESEVTLQEALDNADGWLQIARDLAEEK